MAIYLGLIFLVFFVSSIVIQCKEIRARYPMAVHQPPVEIDYSFDMINIPKNPVLAMMSGDLRRRKVLSARFKNVFGNSKVIEGSEFIPQSMDDYTGKLFSGRKEVFNWQAKKRLVDYFLF
ncbi:hypothetical protein Ddc_08534 [Ditylenchus destructor]|nr:hypothetical protein Ddc_08534 [Ditylenchus destructor]